MKRIFKNHLYRNIGRNIIFAFAIILFFSVSLLLNINAESMNRERKNIENMGYSYVVETKREYSFPFSMYKLDTMNSISNGIENKSVRVYVQTNESIARKKVAKLKRNEAIITTFLAKNLNLNVGGNLFVQLVNDDSQSQYKVADIIDINYDFYNIDKDLSYSFIMVGNDNTIIEGTKGSYTNFFTTNEYNEFMENNNSYKDYYNISGELNLFNDLAIKYDTYSFAINLILVLLLYFLFIKILKKEDIKYMFNNFALSDVDKFIKLDLSIYLFAPVAIMSIIYIILNICKVISWLSLIYILAIMILLSLMCSTRRYFYEKNYI